MTMQERDEQDARTKLDELTRQFKGYPPVRIAEEVWKWAVEHRMAEQPSDTRISEIYLDLTFHRTVSVSRCPDCTLVATAEHRRRAVQMVREHLVEDHGITRPRRHLRQQRSRSTRLAGSVPGV